MRYAAIFGLFLLAGCATTGTARVAPGAPKAENCALAVHASEREVGRPFETVCLLDAKTATHLFADKSVEAAVARLRPEACRCGADALLLTRTEQEGVTFWSWGQGRASAAAIRYK